MTDSILEPQPRVPCRFPIRADCRECIFEHIRQPCQATHDGYVSRDGFQALEEALNTGPRPVAANPGRQRFGRQGVAPDSPRAEMAVRAGAPGSPKTIVCNADEGEPGCFKDRAILEYDPYAVLEGMILAAFAAGAELGFIYLRYEYPELQTQLEEALTACRAAGLLGRQTGSVRTSTSISAGVPARMSVVRKAPS